MTLDALFSWSAVVGGALFLVQLVFSFLGGTADVDVDVDVHAHAPGDVGHASADLSFKVLSLQGITAFVMMFGLVGLAERRESGWAPLPSLVGALVAGAASVWVIAKLFELFSRMQSDGTLDMSKAVGATGSVYLNIAKDKPGKVQVTVAGRLMTLDAITRTESMLEQGRVIRVTKVLQDSRVEVEPT